MHTKKLRYFDIKRSLSNSSGKDEIMKDIEMRCLNVTEKNRKRTNTL
jgi:hypothetical protein